MAHCRTNPRTRSSAAPRTFPPTPAPLTDANLNGATLTVTLPTGVTFSSGVSASSFVLVTSPALTGLSIGSVTGGSTTAILTLATDAGYVFDVSATIAVRVLAAANSEGVVRHSPTLVFSPTVVNLPPRAVGSFADLDLDVGESAELRLAGAFADQGPLSYRVESSAPSVASVRVSGSAVLRVEGLSKGLATMTVTATDRGGLSAQLSFRVRVGRVLSFAAPSASAPEGGAVRLALTLSRPASAALSVPWVARPDEDPDTADADAADLGAMSGTAAFAPGETEAFIEVAVSDDDDIEPAREFLAVALAAPPEGADWVLGPAEATLVVLEGVCDRSPAVRGGAARVAGLLGADVFGVGGPGLPGPLPEGRRGAAPEGPPGAFRAAGSAPAPQPAGGAAGRPARWAGRPGAPAPGRQPHRIAAGGPVRRRRPASRS